MKKWHWICLAILAVVSLIAEFFIQKPPYSHGGNSIPAFFLLFGFFGSWALISAAKILKKWLHRDDTYYHES